MKNTDVSWRSKIGGWFGSCSNNKCEATLYNNGDKVFILVWQDAWCFGLLCALNLLNVIRILLVIGGVEINPGPDEKISFKELTLSMIVTNANKSKKSKLSPRHHNSVWGRIADKLLGINTPIIRTFIRNFHDIGSSIDVKNINKYDNVCLANILLHHSQLTDTEKEQQNMMRILSVWGHLAMKIFSTNTLDDRRFLSKLMNIGVPVLNIGPEIESPSKPSVGVKTRKRRIYKKTVYKGNKMSHSSSSPPPPRRRRPPPSDDANTTTTSLISTLSSTLNKQIWNFATSECEVCMMKIYTDSKHRYRLSITPAIESLIRSHDECYILPDSNELIVCARCHSNLCNGNMPPKAIFNGMALPPVPQQIKCLSSAEIRLVSQVKAFMKVYLLCQGRGQKAMKGLVVHFPLQINEVITQLPLTNEQLDFVVVNEKGDKVEHTTSLRVRPSKIYDALTWLVNNNPLYRNIKINQNAIFNPIPSIELDNSTPIVSPVNQENAQLGYAEVGTGTSVLRASMCQNHPIFMRNVGKQCTAMSASFLAHCFVQSPDSWVRNTLDEVLMTGNDYYTSVISRLNYQHDFLTADEVAGTIHAFGGAEVNLNVDNSTPAIQFQGYANRACGADLPRVRDKIREFLHGGYRYGILTMGCYSMGIFADGDHVYYFDSHTRGKAGGKTRGRPGTACLVKIDGHIADSKISGLVNRNCISSTADRKDLANLRFTLTAFEITGGVETSTHLGSVHDSLLNSPLRKLPRDEEAASETDSSNSSEDEAEEFPPKTFVFGHAIETDCVIQQDDLIEPNLEDVIDGNYDLNRINGSPLHEYLETQLDLLAFPNLFPHGKDGLKAYRKTKITALDYFQQRIMSADPRFHGATDFLFYALSETDKQRARSKIGICCQQRNQAAIDGGEDLDLGVRDPHVYMSGIRGTSSYWKQYAGDLIAMVKTLGPATFFLTWSYDDLNADDTINALWKSKQGSNVADIKASDMSFEERKELLNNDPITAARHFSMRTTKILAFLKTHSLQIFGRQLVDYSIRIEFQARGSPHAHCLLWLKDAPAWDTPEGIAFLERNVSCAADTSYSDIVQRYQRHAHTKTCFKKQNSTCRFSFPKPVCDESKILGEDETVRNKGRFFQLKRVTGEEYINYYHPILLPILKCNMDIQPVTGAVAIAFYIAKYMSKSEPMEIRQDIQKSIKTINASSIPNNQKMFRIAMTLMRNREVSAQEASFRICHLFLRYSSRGTVFLPTYRKENRVRMLKRESIAQGLPEFCTNIIDRYIGRPRILEDICLFEFASQYSLERRVSKAKEGEKDDDLMEFQEDLMKEEETAEGRILYNCKDSVGRSIGKVFKRQIPAVVKHPNFHPINDRDNYYYSLLLLYLPFREENFCDSQSPLEVFQTKREGLRSHSDSDVIHRELSDEIDRALLRLMEFSEDDYDQWNIDQPFQPNFEESEAVVLSSQEELFTKTPPRQVATETIRQLFAQSNPEQRGIFHKVHDALRASSNNFRLTVLADAGTGKTYTLKMISLLIKQYLGEESLLIAAPTAKAAFPIGGSTCHRVFALPVQHGFIKSYQKLNSKRLEQLRRLYRNVNWIFIDEVSMLSYENFRAIHLRLCEIFNTDGLEPFAGKNLILWGDLMQLPPVKASRIFLRPKAFDAEVDLWREFQFSELTRNMRQGTDPLGKICSELRVGRLSDESLRLLKTRVVKEEDIGKGLFDTFHDAVRIYAENGQCKTHNRRKTRELRETTMIYNIKAFDTYGDGTKRGERCPDNIIPQKEEDTGGLPNSIQLGIGSRIMLRKNLDFVKGHCNGSTGIVKKIEWRIDTERQIEDGDLPKRVLIRFDHEHTDTWVEPTTVDFYGKRQIRITRLTLPLILSWGITTHKSQGQSLHKAVIYLGSKCKTKGLAYVAVSRVTTLAGLAIIDLDEQKLRGGNGWVPADEDALMEVERLRGTLSILGGPSQPPFLEELERLVSDTLNLRENASPIPSAPSISNEAKMDDNSSYAPSAPFLHDII